MLQAGTALGGWDGAGTMPDAGTVLGRSIVVIELLYLNRWGGARGAGPAGRGRGGAVALKLGGVLGRLRVTWTVSFFYFIKLHQFEAVSDVNGAGNPFLERNEAVAAANRQSNDTNDNKSDQSSKDVHVVFSTDCSGYQHWQSIASYYSFRRAGHLGPITRIVSGCQKTSQEEAIQVEFQKIQRYSNNQLRLHFTPSFALVGKHYKYSNKPGGLYDWMNHTTLQETVVALVDPDMMALRPIVPQLGEGMTSMPVSRDGYRDLVEYKDKRGKILLLRQKQLPPLPSHVTNGVAAGQHFGIGGLWASAGMGNARKDFKDFNLTMICGANSPCLNVVPPHKKSDEDGSSNNKNAYTTREFADKNYAVGPVYIASASDWMALLPRWHDFTPRVHDQYPKLLAEMYAFTMSAADMQLKFALSSSYMVSDPNTMSTTEGWLWIDDYARRTGPSVSKKDFRQHPSSETLRSVCEGATSNSLPTETLHRLENYGYGNYHHSSDTDESKYYEGSGALPTLLHYCQNYKFANHTWAKRKMPHDFFSCDGSPLKLDVEAILKELDSIENDSSLSVTQKKKQMRNGFMLCHLTPLMNMALDEYKLDVCRQ
ncbi:hypothetical protein ACHAXR_011838 [Thalassiosira sp. AJA248-18]